MGGLSRREIKSIVLYVLDWLLILAMVLAALSFSKITPNLRPFSASDPTISFPFQHHPKIPSYLLFTISTIIPGVIICITVFALPIHRQKGLRSRLLLLNTSLLGLGLALAATMLVTDGMKNLVGKPRPDLLSRCQLDQTKADDERFRIPGTVALYQAQVCTSWYNTTSDGISRAELIDGFRSWVSGHSGLSFAGNTYLTIFLYSNICRALAITASPTRIGPNSNPHPSTPLALVVGIPILAAIYVATTRFSDFRHHGMDILSGSLLGVAMGLLGWAWYGSRTVYGYPILGGFPRHAADNYEYNVEAGTPESEKLTGATRSGYYGETSIKTTNTVEREHFGGSSQHDSRDGALQLQRVRLSDDQSHGSEALGTLASEGYFPRDDRTAVAKDTVTTNLRRYGNETAI